MRSEKERNQLCSPANSNKEYLGIEQNGKIMDMKRQKGQIQ